MFLQMWFSSHRLRKKFKSKCLWYKDAGLLEYEMGNYVFLQHEIMLERTLKVFVLLKFSSKC